MTLKDWAEQQTGLILLIPAGTIIGHQWYYLEDGAWTQTPTAWNSEMPKEYREIRTTVDQQVEVRINAGGLLEQAKKALGNASGKSFAGALGLIKRGGKR